LCLNYASLGMQTPFFSLLTIHPERILLCPYIKGVRMNFPSSCISHANQSNKSARAPQTKYASAADADDETQLWRARLNAKWATKAPARASKGEAASANVPNLNKINKACGWIGMVKLHASECRPDVWNMKNFVNKFFFRSSKMNVAEARMS